MNRLMSNEPLLWDGGCEQAHTDLYTHSHDAYIHPWEGEDYLCRQKDKKIRFSHLEVSTERASLPTNLIDTQIVMLKKYSLLLYRKHRQLSFDFLSNSLKVTLKMFMFSKGELCH